jgi:cell pole-organizing protein PopZ
MRDLLSKLDAIVSETELKNPEDLQAKRNALADLEKDPVASDDPEISSAITQRKSDLEKEAKAKGFAESFEVGDEFGISFSEDHEIATTIVDILEDGIVIELDDTALDMLTNEGLNFLEGELVEDKQKGVDGKACWKGYKRMGTKQKGGKTVDNCVKMEDHGPENPDAPVNYGEYDREGDMAKDDLRTIDDAAEELYSILRADDNLPEWVQSKITKAVDYIDTARDYMKAQNYEEGVAEGDVDEAKYQGREVPLGKKMAGDVKKSKVYVRKPNGNIVKVNFGDKKMRIKKSNPARRKSFRARHNCANPGPRHKARYWSCRSW